VTRGTLQVSEAYTEIINNLVPSVPDDTSTLDSLHNDQGKICAWLTEEVEDWDPPDIDPLADIPSDYDEHKIDVKPVAPVTTVQAVADSKPTIPRIDLYQKLLNAYETQRFRWNTFKTRARPKNLNEASAEDIDNFNRMLASYAPIVDAKLESLWALVLVRGQYHRVRRFLGFVDSGSASEALQKAKENLRASVMRSIDDTEDVYPVYFTPASWAKKLSTAFKPQDLLSDASIIREQILDKEKERAGLLLRQNALKAGQQDVAALEDAEAQARASYSSARDKMLKGYSDTAITIIQEYFNVMNKAGAAVEKLTEDDVNAALKQSLEPPLSAAQFQKLRDMQGTVIEAQSAVQNASEALSRAQLAAAAARGSDGSTTLYNIEQRVQALTLDIDYLNKVLSASDNPLGVSLKVPKPNDAQGNPVPDGSVSATDAPAKVPTGDAPLPPQDEDASVWTEIVLSYTQSTSATSNMQYASASESNWKVGLFFGSASGSKSESTSGSASSFDATNTDIKIAFRCMKVVLNRPWLSGSMLMQSKEFVRSLRTEISGGAPGEVKAALEAKTGGEGANPGLVTKAQKALLPAWPTAFIIVKDVHIILDAGVKWERSMVQDMQKRMSAGGGVLCFSVSKSESSSEHRAAASMSSEETRLSIKIPAPQIIGWIQELCPVDETQTSYTVLKDSEYEEATLPGRTKPQVPPVA
jgi:hypothetical protein